MYVSRSKIALLERCGTLNRGSDCMLAFKTGLFEAAFTELVKVRVEAGAEFSLQKTTELWSTKIHLRVVEAIIFRKPVKLVPRGWSIGLWLEGVGIDEIADALKGKAKAEFIHLRASDFN